VVTEEDHIVGIDLDHCRDPKTGKIEPWAQDIIETVDSYTELSPSGTGIRIFVTANFRSSINRKGGVEIYSTGRYLTVTGHVV
jgi:primase-polymerase (primpol)-like protein